MTTQTSTGVILGISETLPATEDAAGYQALTFTEIGEVVDGGSYGATQEQVTHSPLATGIVEKKKGFRDYGSSSLSMGTDASDAGQALLQTASDDNTDTMRAFSWTYPNGDVDYFQALVFGFDKSVGTANSIVSSTTQLGINTKIVYSTTLTPETVDLFLTIGNSHTAGRSAAEPGDVFNAKVLQYAGSTDIIGAPVGAQLDHNDTNQGTGQYSKDMSFSNDYIAANPNIDNLVFVPYAQGASGFSTLWDPALVTGDRLQTAVNRFNTTKALLEAEGKTVKVGGVLWHNANPDYNAYTPQQHEQVIGDFIDYVRANLDGGATVPIVIGGGMMKDQLDTLPAFNVRFSANLNGSEYRYPLVASYDTINPQHGFSTGLPLTIFDGIHCDRPSEIIKGTLAHNALIRAITNTDPAAPFDYSEYHNFFDFRGGTGKDRTGSGNDLVDTGTTNPLIDYDTSTERNAFYRLSGSGAIFRMTSLMPASYTINFMFKPAAIATQGFVYDSLSPEANQFRFGILNSGSDISAGHLANSSDVSTPSNILTVGTYSLVSLSYDAATTTMKLFVNGVEMDSNNAVANHAAGNNWFGGMTDTQNGMQGYCMFCAIADSAQPASEILDLYNDAIALVINP